MKKMIKISFNYFILAMIAGIFYREFSKYNNFTGRTSLAFVHGHFLALGTLVFLIISIFVSNYEIDKNKNFKNFLILYNLGLLITGIMLILRGIIQIKEIAVSSAVNGAVSGIAGLGHILLFIGFLILFRILINITK